MPQPRRERGRDTVALVLSGGAARGAYETHWARASLASSEAGTPRSGRSSRRAARAAGGFRSRGPCGPSSPPTGSEKRARRGASSSGARPPSPFTRPRSPSERGLTGLAPIGLHECRHTYAAFMIAAGVNAKALSTYMGHASITITLDRYGHLMPGSEGEAAKMLEGYLAG